MKRHDASAAIITPPGEGGIGIIALWGPDAARVLDRSFVGTKRPAASLPVGAIAHGAIRRGDATLDEVIVARLDGGPGAPHFEVNCHGGVVAVRAVLQLLEESGAEVVSAEVLDRPRPDGPLTADAIRAAALAALPHAPTRLAATMLLHQAAGALERELDALRDLLARGKADEARARLDGLLATAPLGRALLHPPTVGLIGPPNAGKSTLLNALADAEHVIVHEEPGTTRDVIAVTVSVQGVPFELMDSAGIRPTLDEIEMDAVRRAGALAAACDVALLVFDAREEPSDFFAACPEPLGPELVAEGLVEGLPPIRPDARVILVGNKADLLGGKAPAPVARQGRLAEVPVVYVSARERTNLDALRCALLAPYEPLIERCRVGGAIVFDAAIESALAAATAPGQS